MARPDRQRKIKDLVPIWLIVLKEPTTNTIIHEKISTTMVRRAVATSESVFFIPHFARIEVSPANTAERIAINSQVIKSHR